MLRKVLYFERAGKENTEECVEIVKKVLPEFNHLVVASTTGETGLKFAEKFANKINLVVVTHSAGFREPNQIEFPQQIREKIEKMGAKVYTGTILTTSLERSLADTFGGSYPTLVIANTFRRLGEGVKVAAEIVMEAVDAGMIPEGEDVLAVAGTDRGADTICVIKSAASRRFLKLKIREILAKPMEF